MSKEQDNQPQQPTAVQVRRSQNVQREQKQGEHVVKRNLTRKQRAVLRVLMDPNHEQRSNEELIQLAGVGADTFYKVKRDPAIQEELRRQSQEYVANHLAPILKASIDTATKPGREGWHDRRWLAEYAGYFVPRRQVDQNVNGQIAVGIVGVNVADV